MSPRTRVLLLVVIMSGVAVGVTGDHALGVVLRGVRPAEGTAAGDGSESSSRDRSDCAAREARRTRVPTPLPPFTTTLEMLRGSHEQFHGFGQTGEFTLAKREGDQIVFLLSHRHGDLDDPQPVPFKSGSAEPMRLALSETLGATVVGLDYRGQRVLAAYEPVKVFDLGIVAKIDLAEVRAPFVRAGLFATGGAAGLILLGIVAFLRIGNPIVRRIEESEEEYRSILHTAMDGFGIVNTQGRFVDVNPAYCDLTGYSREELLTMGVPDVEVAESAEETAKHMRQVIETGCDRFDTKHRCKDGRVVDVEVSGTYMKGEPDKCIVFLRDVTERKQTEEALQRIQWLLTKGTENEAPVETPRQQPYGDLTKLNTNRLILDSVGADILSDIANDFLSLLDTSTAIYEKNGDYALGLFSSGWCQFLDNASRNLCGTDGSQEALACGKWHCHESCWTEASRAAIETGQPADIECNGGIHLYAVPIRAGSEVVGAINFGYGDPPRNEHKLQEIAQKYAIASDELLEQAEGYESRPHFIIEIAKERLLTSARLIGEIVERKQTEERLAMAHGELESRAAQLEAANEELAGYAHAVSHDVMAPLRAIHNYVDFLREDLESVVEAQQAAYLDGLGRAVRQGEELVQDLLELSGIGSTSGRIEAIDVGQFVRELIASLDLSPQVEIVIGSDLPTIDVDRTLLRQIIQNLIANAAKFNRSDRKRVEIGWIAVSRDRGELFVRDNGIGIEPRYREQIFRIFERLHTREEYEGTGIGLALVAKAASRLDGSVRLESEIGEGTTFFVALPKRQHQSPPTPERSDDDERQALRSSDGRGR